MFRREIIKRQQRLAILCQTLGRFRVLRFIGSQEAIEDYEIDVTRGRGEGSALPIYFEILLSRRRFFLPGHRPVCRGSGGTSLGLRQIAFGVIGFRSCSCATRRIGNSIPSTTKGLPLAPPARVSHQFLRCLLPRLAILSIASSISARTSS